MCRGTTSSCESLEQRQMAVALLPRRVKAPLYGKPLLLQLPQVTDHHGVRHEVLSRNMQIHRGARLGHTHKKCCKLLRGSSIGCAGAWGAETKLDPSSKRREISAGVTGSKRTRADNFNAVLLNVQLRCNGRNPVPKQELLSVELNLS